MTLYEVSINNQPYKQTQRDADSHRKKCMREKNRRNSAIISALGICVCAYLLICVAFTAF